MTEARVNSVKQLSLNYESCKNCDSITSVCSLIIRTEEMIERERERQEELSNGNETYKPHLGTFNRFVHSTCFLDVHFGRVNTSRLKNVQQCSLKVIHGECFVKIYKTKRRKK